MRTSIIAIFVFIASFGIPLFANAQSCVGDNYGISGTCQSSSACSASNTDSSAGCPFGLICCSQTTTTTGVNTGVTLTNPLGSASLETFLLNILDFVIRIGSIVVILMVVFVGFKFVTAQGKPGEIEAAKGMLLWTVVGALILLGAKAIALGIKATVQALGG